MVKRKSCYELYVYGRLAARGDIDLVADTLGAAVSTAQHLPYEMHCPQGLELVKLPTVYSYDGKLLTADEISERYHVKKGAVFSTVGRKLLGKPISKHGYDTFSVGVAKVEEWRRDGKCQTSCK